MDKIGLHCGKNGDKVEKLRGQNMDGQIIRNCGENLVENCEYLENWVKCG